MAGRLTPRRSVFEIPTREPIATTLETAGQLRPLPQGMLLRHRLGQTHGTLTSMTSEYPTYPELTAEDERRNALLQAQIARAIVIAVNDTHAVLDTVLNAPNPDAARRALEDRYLFTETQARVVMDLQFERLTSTDRNTFERHKEELDARVAALDESLGGI